MLNDASGAQRARTRFYTEFRGDGKAWATTHLQCDDTNVYAGLNHDGDFALSQGSFIGKTAKLLSNVSNPLTLQSEHPTIKFDETDRPEGSPDYAFICDGGNWRIEKNHWEAPVGGNCISYNYASDEIVLPNLKVVKGNSTLTKTSIYDSAFGRRLSIETKNTATTNSEMLFWGSDTRGTVLEYSYIDPGDGSSLGYGFFCQLNTDNTVKFQVNGVVNCTTLNQSSDRDLKDNIQVIGDATEAIRKMNGYTYTLKENGLPYAGVIAQEVIEALPEAVGSFTHYGKELQGPTVDGNELREETRYLNVDYAAVTGLLVQVARETDNRVTELEEENASLRANIAVMDERIAKLEALVSKLAGSEK
ncbi:TPA: tail fiber domain-containing protein [Escherichia coli]|nr:tail fiber domain-containing protein [Escherichia coli]